MKTGMSWYQNLKFRKKIQIICFVVSLIPVILLGAFCTIQSRRLLVSQEETNINNILEQAASSLKHYLSLQESIITTLAWDEAIQSAVDKSYGSNYEMFLANTEVFDSKFLMIQAMHPEIEGITLYTDTNLYPHGTTLKQLSDLKEYSWYEDALSAQKPFYIFDETDGKFLLVYLLPCRFYKNVMIITLSYDYAFSGYKSLFEDDYAVGIYDSAGRLIFGHSSYEDAPADVFFDNELEQTLSRDAGSAYFREVATEDAHGWNIVIYRPQEFITSTANSFIVVILWMIALCIFSMIYLGLVLSRHLVDPLEKLADNMDQIQADNFTVTVRSRNNDEIAKLIGAFDNMARRLESTIHELYINKLAKQEYRLQMLQSQINPHFLNNTLEIINWEARMHGEEKVSSMIEALSVMMSATMDRNRQSLITLEEEMEYVNAYLYIIECRYQERFTHTEEIDEALLPVKVPRLIIQPVIENAVEYGNTGDDRRSIALKIEGTRDGEKVDMKIMIINPGEPSAEDMAKIKELLTDEIDIKPMEERSTRIGIRNVNRRLKMIYGGQSHLTIEPDGNGNTISTIFVKN